MNGSIWLKYKWRKPLKRVEEKLVQNPLENLIENSPQKPQFIGLEKLAVGVIFQPWRLTVDRPGQPPTVRILIVGASVDRPGRPLPGTESRALCRSTGPVDRGFPESRALWTVDRPGGPALQPDTGVHAVHVGRPSRSTDFKRRSTVPVDRLKPGHKFWDKKFGHFGSIKIP